MSNEHTPSTEDIQLFKQIAQLRYSNELISPERRAQAFDHFDYMLNVIEAAAEQRGAEPFINMIERVAEHPSLIGTQTAQDTKQLLDSIQANHTEGDE